MQFSDLLQETDLFFFFWPYRHFFFFFFFFAKLLQISHKKVVIFKVLLERDGPTASTL